MSDPDFLESLRNCADSIDDAIAAAYDAGARGTLENLHTMKATVQRMIEAETRREVRGAVA